MSVWHKKGYVRELRDLSRKGCLLSLFSLYLNDLDDSISGEILVGNLKIKLLAFADDVRILSDSVTGLQDMINELQKYGSHWNQR